MTIEREVAGSSPATELVELYEREYLAMVRLARLIVGSAATAEEIVHDAFVVVIEREATIDNLGAYLRQVVVNNCRSATRRSSVGRRKVAQLAARGHQQVVELSPELDETWDALDLVTPKQRTALVLRFYADLAVKEIAETMDERPGTVKSLIHRGLSTLRKELSL